MAARASHNTGPLLPSLTPQSDPYRCRHALLADINNQDRGAERLVDRKCIFEWVSKNMSTEKAHEVFYDEERAEEFADLDPSKPEKGSEYEPFLSPKMLRDVLLGAGMVQQVETL